MHVLGFAGWSGSGKTTLIVQLIPLLRSRGLRVAVIKYAHHGFEMDTPGKDSWRVRQAGAGQVLVSSGQRWALVHELAGAPEPGLREHLERLAPCELVIVEGYKREPIPKIEVRRSAHPSPLLAPSDPWIIAIASDQPLAGEPLPVLDLDDIPGIAGFVVDWLAQGGQAPTGAARGEQPC